MKKTELIGVFVLKPEQLNRTKNGLPFLGYRIFPYIVRLQRGSKKRYLKKMKILDKKYHNREWPEVECQRRGLSLFAFANRAAIAGIKVY